MNNLSRKDLNPNGPVIQKAELKPVKLVGANALAKPIGSEVAPVMEQPAVVNNPAPVGVVPSAPQVVETYTAPAVTPPAVEAIPVAPAIDVMAQQVPNMPPSMPGMPVTPPEVYNPIPQAPVLDNVGLAPALDDAQKPLETPADFSQNMANAAPASNLVNFPSQEISTPPVGENIFDMPVVNTPIEEAPVDAKVEPLPGTTNEDRREELKAVLLTEISASIDRYEAELKKVPDAKSMESAMSGLDKVQNAVTEGSQILSGQPYQPETIMPEAGMSRAA